jgi:predicted SnoaL-like aldol condensation-catalyzing enzyme
MSPSTVVNRYLDAFYAGKFREAQALIADNYQFEGPFVEATNREAYFASAARLAPMVKGHTLLRQWVDGDEVCSIYDVALETPAGKGSVTMSEWHRSSQGKLTSGRVVFDTAAFRALMPAK